MKRNNEKIWIEVDRILWEEWDPIGLNNGNGFDNEYRGYVPSLVKLIKEGADETKIAKLLRQHANVNIGLSSSIQDHIKVAQKLKGLTD